MAISLMVPLILPCFFIFVCNHLTFTLSKVAFTLSFHQILKEAVHYSPYPADRAVHRQNKPKKRNKGKENQSALRGKTVC